LKDTFGITIARDANLSKQGMARAMHVYGVCPSRHRCRELLRMVASDCDKEIMACKTAIEKVGLVTHANQAAPHVLRDTDLDEEYAERDRPVCALWLAASSC